MELLLLRYMERHCLKILHLDCHPSEAKLWHFLEVFEKIKHSERTQGGAAALEVEGRKLPACAPLVRCSAAKASRKGRFSEVEPRKIRALDLSTYPNYLRDTRRQISDNASPSWVRFAGRPKGNGGRREEGTLSETKASLDILCFAGHLSGWFRA